MTRMTLALVVMVGSLAAAGCAPSRHGGTLPCGQWTGHGTYAIAKWQAHEDNHSATPEGHASAVYDTSLTIERTGNDPESFRIEIVSERGPIPYEKDLGNRTHLVIMLEREFAKPFDGVIGYRVTKVGIAVDDSEPDMQDGPEGMTLATSIARKGELVLTLHYQDGFCDMLHFRGNEVWKTGTYFVLDEGALDWVEHLKKK